MVLDFLIFSSATTVFAGIDDAILVIFGAVVVVLAKSGFVTIILEVVAKSCRACTGGILDGGNGFVGIFCDCKFCDLFR